MKKLKEQFIVHHSKTLVHLEKEIIELGSVKTKRIYFYQSSKGRKEDSQSSYIDKFIIQIIQMRDQVFPNRISNNEEDYDHS